MKTVKTPKTIIRLTIIPATDPRFAGQPQVTASRVKAPHYFNGDLAVRGNDRTKVLTDCARRCASYGTPVTHYVECATPFGIIEVNRETLRPI